MWICLHLVFYDKTPSAQKGQRWLCLDSISGFCTYEAVNSSMLHFSDAGRFLYRSTLTYGHIKFIVFCCNNACVSTNSLQHLNAQISLTFSVWHLRLGHIHCSFEMAGSVSFVCVCFLVAQFIPYIWSVSHCTTWFSLI